MKVEWYAAVVALVGVLLWLRGSVFGSAIAVLFFTIFGGGAAFIVGGASITPASFAIVFLLAHVLLSMFSRRDHVNRGLRTNGYLALFCFYGVLAAYIFPRIFLHQIYGPAVTVNGRAGAFAATPLHYSKQNITAAIYLVGVLVASICAGAASADQKSRRLLVRWAIVIAWMHIAFGLAALILESHGGAAVIKVFRNATYAELLQTESGYIRITGIFPEPAAYAGYAFGWLVLMTEWWLRDVSPRLTLITAIALTIMLIACTSTSGYAAMAIYAVILGARLFLAPSKFSAVRVVTVGMVILTLVTMIIAACAFLPHLADSVGRVISSSTVRKVNTYSGQQRLYLLQSAIAAVKMTWGIGVGPGSFRSSSLLFAIVESTGVVGLAVFAGHFLSILKVFRRETYVVPGPPESAIAVGVSWAACIGLIPAFITSPTAIPSYVFAILGGLALGWRFSSAHSAVAAEPVSGLRRRLAPRSQQLA